MTEQTRRTVAAFDFDGTLTRRDTLVPFLAQVSGPAKFGRVLSEVAALAARRRINGSDRDAVKEEMLRRLFTGRRLDELRERGETYAQKLLNKQMNDATMRRLHEHLTADHEVLLVSASLIYYLDPIAAQLGLSQVIAVEPEAIDGVLTGALSQPNVRADQKALRLREWLGGPDIGPLVDTELWSYGNSSGDHALLELADHPYWVGRPSKLPMGSRMFIESESFAEG